MPGTRGRTTLVMLKLNRVLERGAEDTNKVATFCHLYGPWWRVLGPANPGRWNTPDRRAAGRAMRNRIYRSCTCVLVDWQRNHKGTVRQLSFRSSAVEQGGTFSIGGCIAFAAQIQISRRGECTARLLLSVNTDIRAAPG